MVLYHYNSNAILFRPMKDRSDMEAVQVYSEFYKYLNDQNCTLRLNIMDNEASTAVKRFISSEDTKFQLVEPNNHQVNAAERAIRTFKTTLLLAYHQSIQNFQCTYGTNFFHKQK